MKTNSIKINNFRALLVGDDYIFGARGYRIYKYSFKENKLIFYADVRDYKYSFFSNIHILRRFCRAEITNLYNLKNQSQILIAKKSIFLKRKEDKSFNKCFDIPRGSRPLNLCIYSNGSIYFGEYFSNTNKGKVNIYTSKDNGNTWSICYTFEEGSINHIHGLFYDKYTNNIWVVTGDRENECIIGYTTDEFKTFTEVFRGGQEYRCCNLIFFKKYIIYATDSQYIENEIKCFYRENLEIKTLCKISGSGIYGGQNANDFSFISSTIEPSKVNKAKYSCLYFSRDGLEWKEIERYNKDIWNKTLFQFGSIQFPNYETKLLKNYIVYSGRALNRIGGNTVIRNVK